MPSLHFTKPSSVKYQSICVLVVIQSTMSIHGGKMASNDMQAFLSTETLLSPVALYTEE